jgi:hypothetical protein
MVPACRVMPMAMTDSAGEREGDSDGGVAVERDENKRDQHQQGEA